MPRAGPFGGHVPLFCPTPRPSPGDFARPSGHAEVLRVRAGGPGRGGRRCGTERGAETEQRDGQQGWGRESLVPGAPTAPQTPARARALPSGAPGWRSGARWRGAEGGGPPGGGCAPRRPPPAPLSAGMSAEEARVSRTRGRQQIYLLSGRISAPSGQVFAPAGPREAAVFVTITGALPGGPLRGPGLPRAPAPGGPRGRPAASLRAPVKWDRCT